MKTKEEILEYIKKQPWYDKFCKNFVENSIKQDDGERTLHLNSSLIARAFTWNCTPEGHEYWSNIHIEYTKWYFKLPVTELTLEQIAEKFNIPVDSLRIKD